MSLAFLLDEHLRGPLWNAIQRHNLSSPFRLDVERVGDSADLPLGSDDAVVLRWAEREGRILVTEDKHTMPGHLRRHVDAGHQSPGVFVVRTGLSCADIVESLVLVAHAGDADDYCDTVTYVP